MLNDELISRGIMFLLAAFLWY